MTVTPGAIIRLTLGLLAAVGAVGYIVVLTVKKAEDPARMVFKWVLTAGVLGVLVGVVAPLVARGDQTAAWVGVPATAACGLALAIIWGHDLATLIAEPFSSLYDGGRTPPIPRPAYSVALARQKQGRFQEALIEVRKQLERFPTDVEGQLLLAQIQAEDLKDLPAAESTIQQFCEQPGHAPQNIVFALYSMADWYLAVAQDREGARRHLEKILERFPDSEHALGATQRLAHLGTGKTLLSPEERKKFAVAETGRRFGLVKDYTPFKPVETAPEQQAAEYIKHLEAHPLDTEAREKLAVLYADHYGRLDLATEQLEQLIALPNQPHRLVAHFLNVLADLQVRSGGDYETVRQTLQRIIDLNPNFAAAELARNRLAILKLELKGKEKNRAVKLGSYEQNLGLKQSLPPGGKL